VVTERVPCRHTDCKAELATQPARSVHERNAKLHNNFEQCGTSCKACEVLRTSANRKGKQQAAPPTTPPPPSTGQIAASLTNLAHKLEATPNVDDSSLLDHIASHPTDCSDLFVVEIPRKEGDQPRIVSFSKLQQGRDRDRGKK
jgi:hypothetical protein